MSLLYRTRNKKYEAYQKAHEKASIAIDEYKHYHVDVCKELLLEASECFDKIFDEKYNPALINICFMARRGEMPEINISVLEVLNKIYWLNGDAFLNINKALAYIQEGKWKEARKEISDIRWNIDEALEWWKCEDIVGRKEKSTVLLLLLLENKIDYRGKITEDLLFAIENIKMPDEIKAEVLNTINERANPSELV